MNQNTSHNRTCRIVRKAFSLIELVIVIVIIAIIGAIAIPKMSRGAAGAGDSALTQDLSVLRSAIDLYQAENGGAYPPPGSILTALTQYNDGTGTAAGISATKDGTHIYGPYLRSVPSLPVGAKKGQSAIGDSSTVTAGTAGFGWIYNGSTGTITANTTTEADSAGKTYNAY